MYYSNIFVKCYIFYIFSFDIFHMSKQNRVGFSECYYSNIFVKCYIFYIFSFDIFHMSKQNRVGFSECYYSNIFLKCYIFYIFSFDIFHISKQNRVGLVNATILCRSVRFHSLPTFLSKIAKTKLLQLFFYF